jgi:hypothetical protein
VRVIVTNQSDDRRDTDVWSMFLGGADLAPPSSLRRATPRGTVGCFRPPRSVSCSTWMLVRDAHRTLFHAALGTVVFVLLAPGGVVVLGPWLLTGWHVAPPLLGWPVTRWLLRALLRPGRRRAGPPARRATRRRGVAAP